MRCFALEEWKSALPAYLRLACLLAGVAVAAGGCSLKGNIDPVPLPDDLPLAWSSPGNPGTLPVTDSLLALIDDAALRRLVDEALWNNPDLSATTSATTLTVSLPMTRFNSDFRFSGARSRTAAGPSAAT